MSDAKQCPACGAELREEAKFCDNCGKPLSPGAVQPGVTAGPAKPGVNWTGVAIVLVICAVAGWLLFGPRGDGQNAGNDGMMANPHASGMGGSMSNPHGEQQGMEGLQQTLGAAKARLDEDPLDRDALFTLYQNYGMIGRADQLRPYLDKAIEALEQRREELGDDFLETGMNVGLAALFGSELDGALAVYRKLNELQPGQPQVLSMLGDVCGAQERYADAVNYYDEFIVLAGEDKDKQYWSAVINRAVAQRLRYEKAVPGEAQPAWLTDSVENLKEAAGAQPEEYSAFYNLGLSYGLQGETDLALAAYEQARPLAQDAMEEWQVDAEVAKLKGDEIPPQPAMGSLSGMEDMGSMDGMGNPHGGMDGEMSNPHGDMGGMSNPHGGMGGS